MELFYTGIETVKTDTHDIIIKGERGDNFIKLCIVDRFKDDWQLKKMSLEDFEKLHDFCNEEYYRMPSYATTHFTMFRENTGGFITVELSETKLDELLGAMENFVSCMI